ERLVEPLLALESGVPAELVRLGLWIAEQYCSTPARGLSLVLPPGTGTGHRSTPAVVTKSRLVAELTSAGEAALEPGSAVQLKGRQRRVLAALAGARRPVSGLRGEPGADHGALRRLEGPGLVALEPRATRPARRTAPRARPRRRAVGLPGARVPPARA